MEKKRYHVLGVMSGTSLDGIDLAEVIFSKGGSWSFELKNATTLPYTDLQRRQLAEAVNYGEAELVELDKEVTKWISGAVESFVFDSGINMGKLDAVCSHGHTAKHEPDKGYTLQIGNRPELASLIGQRVVCDFRVQDVELGGQGAPLVPIGDELLFGEYDYCLNLGGFANVSTNRDGNRIAYDICPVNTVLNYLAEQTGRSYDEGGWIAAQGQVDESLLEYLNSLEYYRQAAPKTLGIEWVNQLILPLFDGRKDIPVLMHTYTVHAATQLASNLGYSKDSKVLVTGGGAFNKFLMSELSKRTNSQIIIPSKKLIDYKESIVFALLGVLRIRGEVNTLSSVTGAREDHSAGRIYEPANSSTPSSPV